MSNLIRLSSARAGASRARDDADPGDARRGERRSRQTPRSETRSLERQQEDGMFDELDRHDRLRLVEFVCSFAWADLEIRPEERAFVARLIRRLDLDEDEDLRVQQWLDRPPSLDDLDPMSIPPAHRRIFVEEIEGLIAADGEVSDEERDSFEIFKQLLSD